MTSFDEPAELQMTDAAFHYGGILFRAIGYLVLWGIAQNYDFGTALLTGVLAGDLIGQLARVARHLRDEPLVQLGEIAFLGLIYLFARPLLVWPEDSAMRAIVGLAAFGALIGHTGCILLGGEDDSLA